MCHWLRAKEQGFVLIGVLLVLVILNLIVLQSFELYRLQANLIELFKHKTVLWQQAEKRLNILALEFVKNDLSSGPDYCIEFDHQDACLNRYYHLEVWAKDALLELHIKALLIKAPKIPVPHCHYAMANKWFLEEF